MGFSTFEVLTGLVVLFVAIYYYLTSNYDFWSSRGVAGPKPELLFGNLKDIILAKLSISDLVKKLYDQYKNEPFFGIYARRTPILVVNDPEYIKDILIKDFTIFADRGFKTFPKIEPLSQHLFSLEPERWRPLRMKLSPTFTSGKLKEMFYLLKECAEHFQQYIDTSVEKSPVIECRELTAKFTTDVIGVCAFGLQTNALSDENSEFRNAGRKFFSSSTWKLVKNRIREAAPWLYKLLGPLMYDREMNEFFIDLIAQTIEYRKKNNVKRNDFVGLLIALKDDPRKVNDIELTDTLIAAQAFVFFIAGFETSSTTISNAMYELAQNHTVQNKLREEVLQELKKNNGDLTYETVKNMKYLNQIFYETLRKYPPLGTLMRKSMEPYTFVGSKLTIPKGITVWIPVYALQRDPKIYPDPDTFDPERFTEENIKQRHPSYWLPFGDGPRNCIGMRFGNYQTKVGLIKLLEKYQIDVCDKTVIPHVNDPKAFLLAPKDGVKLKLTKIK